MTLKSSAPSELGLFQLVILILSVFVLGGLAASLIWTLPPEVARTFRGIDNLVCVAFLVDFVVRFSRAESKLRFMRWGWIDLLSSIPEIQALRWARVFRIIRVVRLLIAARSLRGLLRHFFRHRTSGGVTSVFTITFLVISISSLAILLVERTPDANIRTAEDAVWWSITTITTVGYGDTYPVTAAGRVIASCLMFTGIALFGTLSGVVAGFFIGDRKPAVTNEAILERLDRLEAELARLRPPR